MADIAYTRSAADEPRDTTYLSSVLRRTSWGAVFAGSVTAITVQMILTVLGVAIGVTATEMAAEPDGYVRDGIKTAAAVWWLATGTVSLFIGGCVVGRFVGMTRSADVLLHGFTMWAVTALFGFIAVTSGAGALYGTAMNSTYAGAQVYHQTRADEGAAATATPADQLGAAEAGTIDRAEAQRYVRTASWWTLFGLLLGIAASLAGSWVTAPERIVLTPPSHRPIDEPLR